MKRTKRFPLVAVFALVPLLWAPFAQAQRGARLAPAAAPAMSAHRGSTLMSAAPLRMGRRGTTRSANAFFSNSLGQVSSFPNLNYGLGLNGINYIATQDIGTEAAIDPATQWRLAIAGRVARATGGFGGGGYYLLDGGGAYAYPYANDTPDADQAPPQQQQQSQQPQVIVVQQAPAQPAQAFAGEQPIDTTPPLPDAGQFTLVLHNGTQIEALAFTQMKDRIIYITRDGSRRTISLSDLDADATVRLNQERGTPLQLSL
jgi:hypothetical protein